ncbi:hypothetical protein ACZ76_07160 [Yersinia aleksiciae]|uniref:Transposase n=1 Tax=Yersinia aleksiciae TaxID=263819 RepID=A0ABM5UCG3_YERAE|nr:hypothetical protein ACZ76_07160 [Yersinia aleksiciae]
MLSLDSTQYYLTIELARQQGQRVAFDSRSLFYETGKKPVAESRKKQRNGDIAVVAILGTRRPQSLWR